MSLLDSFGSLFGKRPQPAYPAIPAGKDPMAAMAEAEAKRYEMSRAPQPTPESLKAVLAKATRVRVLEGGMWAGKALGTVVRLDTSDPGDLFGLRDRLRIDREPGGHCSCLGGHAMELYAGTKMIAIFGLHHGSGIRWEEWKDDARISSPDVFVSWMQAHGIPEPFEELRKARHAARVSQAATTKWEAAAPAALKPLLADAIKGTVETTELLLAMDAGVAEEPEKVRQLLKWYGCTNGKWSGGPAFHALPATLLVKFRWQVLVEAMLTEDGDVLEDPAQLEGAARFFSGTFFLEQRVADLARFSKELKDRLLKHAKDSGDKEKAAQVEAALKQAAAVPPPAAPKAEAGKKKPGDDDEDDDDLL